MKKPVKIADKNFRAALPVVAATLGKSYGVQVNFNTNGQVGINGKQINMPYPDESNPDAVTLTRGYLDLSAGKIRHTDKQFRGDKIFNAIGNILEDYRVEEEMALMYPGCNRNFRDMTELLVDDALKEGSLQVSDNDLANTMSWMFSRVRSWRSNRMSEIEEHFGNAVPQELMEKLEPELEKFRTKIKDGSIKNTRTVEKYTDQFYKMIEQFLDIPPQPPQQGDGEGEEGEGDGQDQDQDSGGKGKSKGKKKSGKSKSDKGGGQSGDQGDDQEEGEGEGEEQEDGEGDGDGGSPRDNEGTDSPDSGGGSKGKGKKSKDKSDKSGGGGAGGGMPEEEQEQEDKKGGQRRDERGFQEQMEDAQNDMLSKEFNMSKMAESEIRDEDKAQVATGSMKDLMRRGDIMKFSANNLCKEMDDSRYFEAQRYGQQMRNKLLAKVQAKTKNAKRNSMLGRLNTRKLPGLRFGDCKVFTRREEKLEFDTLVHLIVDLSGSMDGKLTLLENATFSLVWALSSVKGIKVAISGFPTYSDELIPILRPDERLHRNFIMQARGGTPLGSALRGVALDMAQYNTERKLALILTDGEPDDYRDTESAIQILKHQGVEVYGVNLLCDSMKNFLKKEEFITIHNMNDLLGNLFKLIENAVM